MKRALLIAGVLVSGVLASAQVVPRATPSEAAAQNKKMFSSSSIQVLEFQSVEVKVPAQFEMAMYENTIDQIQKLEKFKNVYRDGDKRAAADPEVVKLKVTILKFKEGSARQRQVTTVAGATSIHVHLRLENAKGVALDTDTGGTVQLFGENLAATQDLARNIAAVVKAHF
jgi:hypothetical protein